MAKRKQNKMSTSEAVKILANESKFLKEQLFATQKMARDFFNMFELYLSWEGKAETYLKHVKETIEKNQEDSLNSVKDIIDEQKTDEQTDESNTSGNKQDKGVRPERVRSQQG